MILEETWMLMVAYVPVPLAKARLAGPQKKRAACSSHS